MKTDQDTRRISSEEWSQLLESSRRHAHELRREAIEGFFHGIAATLQTTLLSASQSIQRLLGDAHPAAKNLSAPPPL